AGNLKDPGSLEFTVPVSESETVDSVFAKLNEITSIDIFASANGENVHGVAGNAGYSSVTVSNDYKSFTKMADVKYEDFVGPGKNTEDIHSADEADMTVKIPINYDKLNNEYLGIKELNVMTEKASDEAMGLIDKAAEIITTQRSVFGAYQNRLEHTIKNIDNVVENTTAAESRIRDTDMAEEMVKLSRSNILQQAGQSVLAQANQTPQGVLSLLQ
ncbi:MAG: flagellar hook protein, partial [Butyrivibrio sp.]|nr:flagellar hook protein [Butyrivibrio sp.]